MLAPKRIVIGTGNPHKVVEILDRLADLPIEILDLGSFPNAPEVIEDGASFAENAAKKASETARAIGEWVMADDSGLVVDALDGAPGIHSARYAGVHGDAEANNAKLLRALSGIPREKRGARFVCVIALADPRGEIIFDVEGRLEGEIAEAGKGDNGFGYDPVFYLPKMHRAVAELSLQEKNRISHRANALSAFRERLLSITESG